MKRATGINTKALPGFMELLPREQAEFDRMRDAVAETFRRYGFTPIDTPAVERGEVLFAKAGGDTEKQIYTVSNRRGFGKAGRDAAGITGQARDDGGDEAGGGASGAHDGGDEVGRDAAGAHDGGDEAELALRYDLTVPLARYVAEHMNDLTFPFRRYHIAKAYRGERPQKGRFREFMQCDIDVVGKGSLSMAYDAEIPSVIYSLFKKLDIGKFTIHINNRKVLAGLLETLAPGDAEAAAETMRLIDKVRKMPEAAFTGSLRRLGLAEGAVEGILAFIGLKGDAQEVLAAMRPYGAGNATFEAGLAELGAVVGHMGAMGVEPSHYAVDPTIVRGLDYYTSTVYETFLDDHQSLGSICSGGRYDDLASNYVDERLPGVGISMGLSRLFFQLREIGLVGKAAACPADVVVVPMEDANINYSLRLARTLREEGGLNVDVLLEGMSVKRKF
ncbi:MAG: histidine--tRNA ligase, partial [Oscillospiraceae bacterium]|nr:histidine--tRNA ligase [Oscillospiraceae bacterium]